MANPQHYTLAAATVKTFTLDEDYDQVEVTNVDGAARIYFTIGADSTPAVATDGSHVVAAVAGSRATIRARTSGDTVVKCISSGTPMVSVRGITS